MANVRQAQQVDANRDDLDQLGETNGNLSTRSIADKFARTSLSSSSFNVTDPISNTANSKRITADRHHNKERENHSNHATTSTTTSSLFSSTSAASNSAISSSSSTSYSSSTLSTSYLSTVDRKNLVGKMEQKRDNSLTSSSTSGYVNKNRLKSDLNNNIGQNYPTKCNSTKKVEQLTEDATKSVHNVPVSPAQQLLPFNSPQVKPPQSHSAKSLPPPIPLRVPAANVTSANLGVSPKRILDDERLRSRLTQHELGEILHYPEVYFIGAAMNKVRPQHSAAIGGYKQQVVACKNFGFDDSLGSYIHVPHDHIAYRYEMLKMIGKGSFGSVVKAYDHKAMQYVALKMVRNEKSFHQQAKIEISILKHLRKNDTDNTMNVVHIYDHFIFRDHTCITFELLSLNLFELTRKNKFAGFSVHLVRRFAYSILKCLEALRENRIIHCDLKPENVLLKQQSRSGIKVIDFGSSCFVDQRKHTYIQSRFYRSPETILRSNYGMPIDMWSLGCILAELVIGNPLLPGEDEGDQLACMMELLGLPPASLLQKSCPERVREFFSSQNNLPRYCSREVLSNGRIVLLGGRSKRGKKIRGPPGSRTWEKALGGCDEANFIDFVRRCLEWDPKLRMTPNQALRHPWIVRRRQQQQQHQVQQAILSSTAVMNRSAV